MKCTCSQKSLHRALTIVNHVLRRNSPLPILHHVLLSTQEHMLIVQAANGDGMSITARVAARVEEPGSLALPPLFCDYIERQSSPDVELSASPPASTTCHIRGGSSQADIAAMDPTDFPLLPTLEQCSPLLLLEAPLLKEIIAQVSFAASPDQSRPIFTALHFQTSHESLRVMAADTYRVAIRSIEIVEDHTKQWLVPASALKPLVRLLPEAGTVQVALTPRANQLLFHMEEMDVIVPLLEGTSPNFDAVIPKEHQTRVIVRRQEFADVIREVAPFAKSGDKSVHLSLRGEDRSEGEATTLTLEARSEEGTTQRVLHVPVFGPAQQVLLNIDYLEDIFEVLDMPEIALEITSAARPIMIEPALGPTAYRYILMPMVGNQPEPTPTQTAPQELAGAVRS